MINDKLFMLSNLVLSDRAPLCDLIYLVAEAHDYQDSVWKMGAELSMQKSCSSGRTKIAISNFQHPYYSGIKAARRITSFDFNSHHKVIKIQMSRARKGDNGFHNTLTEMHSLLNFCRENNFMDICLVAAPFHQLRTYISAISVIHHCGSLFENIRVFNNCGSPLSPSVKIKYTDGNSYYPRELFIIEGEKILRYQKKEDLASFPVVLKYFLKHRHF